VPAHVKQINVENFGEAWGVRERGRVISFLDHKRFLRALIKK